MDTLIAQILATSPMEAAAVVLSLAYLLLAVRRNLLCWLCAFGGTVLTLVLVARASLYMQVLLNAFYLVMAVYGFLEWRRGQSERGGVAIRSWPLAKHALVAVFVIVAAAINGYVLAHTTQAAAPYLDSFVTWGSVITTWMVARRIIENWLYWIVFDGAAAWLYYSQGLLFFALLFVVYVGIVIRGYFVWRREQAAQRAIAPSSAEPA
jgi:nicotinamide mononucleotide transporter